MATGFIKPAELKIAKTIIPYSFYLDFDCINCFYYIPEQPASTGLTHRFLYKGAWLLISLHFYPSVNVPYRILQYKSATPIIR